MRAVQDARRESLLQGKEDVQSEGEYQQAGSKKYPRLDQQRRLRELHRGGVGGVCVSFNNASSATMTMMLC